MPWPLYVRLGLSLAVVIGAAWTASVVWHTYRLGGGLAHVQLAGGFGALAAAVLTTATALSIPDGTALYRAPLRTVSDSVFVIAFGAVSLALLVALRAPGWRRWWMVLQALATIAIVSAPRQWLGTVGGVEIVRPLYVYVAVGTFFVLHAIPVSARFGLAALRATGVIRLRGISLAMGVVIMAASVIVVMLLTAALHAGPWVLVATRIVFALGAGLTFYGAAGSPRHAYVVESLHARVGDVRRWVPYWMSVVIWALVTAWALLAAPRETSQAVPSAPAVLALVGAAVVGLQTVLVRRDVWLRIAPALTLANLALLGVALWVTGEIHSSLTLAVAVATFAVALQWGIAAGFAVGWTMLGLAAAGAIEPPGTAAAQWLLGGSFVAAIAGISPTLVRQAEAEQHLTRTTLALTDSLEAMPDFGAVAHRLAATLRKELDLDRCRIVAGRLDHSLSGETVAVEVGEAPTPLPDDPRISGVVALIARPISAAYHLEAVGVSLGELVAERSIDRGGITYRLRRHLEVLARQTALVLHMARLWEMKQALAAGRERERAQADLHDGAAQALAGARMLIASRVRALQRGEGAPAALREGLEMLEQAQAMLQRFLSKRPAQFDLRPLQDRLRDLVDVYRRLLHIPIALECDRFPAGVDPLVAEVAESVVRGGLSNVWRHARASTASVRASIRDGRLIVSIADDGRGPQQGPTRHSTGLRLVRRRVARLGGTVELLPREPRGAELLATIPIVSGLRQVDTTASPVT